MTPPLIFDRTTKRFRNMVAVDTLTLEVGRGEIVGFLGANGAGKTTAMHMAMGFLRPSSGGGSLLGRSFGDASARARVGFVPDAPVFFAGSPVAAVALGARLNGMHPQRAEIERTLDRVGIRDRKRDVRKYSRGMQQRLGLALALVHDPELLILDEPAAALDPPGVLEIRELLSGLREQGKSILLSSHQLGEAEELCDRVAFLAHGKLLRFERLADVLRASGQIDMTVRGLAPSAPLRAAYSDAEVPVRDRELTQWRLPVAEQQRAIEGVWSSGAELVSVRPAQRSLADLFRQWTESAAEERNGSGHA